MSALAPDVSALVAVSAAMAAHDGGEALATAFERAEARARPEQVEEVLLQGYLFLGFPAALTAMASWRERAGPTGHGAGEDPAAEEDLPRWTARGEEICRIIYGASYDRLRSNVARSHPALDRWMISEGYGKVLGRPGLGLVARELCIVALLAVSAREPQLHSHMRGALNAGAPPAAVEAALNEGLQLVRNDAWQGRAKALWERVRARHEARGED